MREIGIIQHIGQNKIIFKESLDYHARLIKCEINDEGCWVIISHAPDISRPKKPYIRIERNHCRTKAHRYVYELFLGKIPKGIHVLHLCDNHKCINPAHLFLGTNYDNVQDKTRKGRGKTNKLSKEQVLEILSLKGSMLHREIASLYGVSRRVIGHIYKSTDWKNINERD